MFSLPTDKVIYFSTKYDVCSGKNHSRVLRKYFMCDFLFDKTLEEK